MILVDSSVWIDYFNDVRTSETDRLEDLLGRRWVGVGDLILTEVLQGFRSEKDFAAARRLLGSLPFEPMLGRALAIAAAQNYRRLRAAGVTVRKTIDVMIATFCIERGYALLHSDRDFDPMEQRLGLLVV